MTDEQLEKLNIIHRVMLEYYFGEEFIVKGRERKAAERRMMFCRHAYAMIPLLTLESIAEYLGKDHSTVIYSINRCKDLCEIDAQYRHDYECTAARSREIFELNNFGVL